MSVCHKLRARRAKRLLKQRAKLPGRIDRKLASDTLRRLTPCKHATWRRDMSDGLPDILVCVGCGERRMMGIDLARTGRTSSSMPNVQNMPRQVGKSSQLKTLLDASVLTPEQVFRELASDVDYAAIEQRVRDLQGGSPRDD